MRNRLGRRGTVVIAALGVLAGLVVAPPAVHAADPPFVPWSALLPGLTAGFDPGSDNLCRQGHTSCVDAVVQEMTRRFDPLAAACNHDAVFSLTYLRTTEEYRRTIEDPTFFSDTAFVNYEDAVFAKYYFEAFDNWHNWRRNKVPPAWKVAFDAADRRAVTATGNLMLGMSAHINRDLPFVLHAIGLVKPDGSSRKPDHDKVNQFLNRVTEPVIAEVARRLDRTADDGNVPGTSLDEAAALQMVVAWREQAWRNAERLANAAGTVQRQTVAYSIEAQAKAEADLLKSSFAYGPLRNSSARDRYCWNHHNS